MALGILGVVLMAGYVPRRGPAGELSVGADEQQVSAEEPARVPYTGRLYHIFFHSLVIYPALAFAGEEGVGYRDNMVTRDEFVKILDALYANDFVLIDIHRLYETTADGGVIRTPLVLPEGKKPLIISLDDLNYYRYMRGRGFADKLVLDEAGEVATEVTTPAGETIVTHDGDIVPLLDAFVRKHPDFSFEGAKGIIALTGFEGVLGYRTQHTAAGDHARTVLAARAVIDRLKATGWQFANHSYAHTQNFRHGTVSLAELEQDVAAWQREVEPLVGETDIYIGPFGQIFSPEDARRAYLVRQGYNMLCGVGAHEYLEFFPGYAAMDRASIDGYRLLHSPASLTPYFQVDI